MRMFAVALVVPFVLRALARSRSSPFAFLALPRLTASPPASGVSMAPPRFRASSAHCCPIAVLPAPTTEGRRAGTGGHGLVARLLVLAHPPTFRARASTWSKPARPSEEFATSRPCRPSASELLVRACAVTKCGVRRHLNPLAHFAHTSNVRFHWAGYRVTLHRGHQGSQPS